MEQQRLVVVDQVLVEREMSDVARQRDRRVDPVDAVGDFVDVGA
jgi:hypothetical protein